MNGATNPLLLHAFTSHTWTTLLLLSGHLFCKEQHQFQIQQTCTIRINWDGEPSGYAENPDNWIFL